MRILNSTRSLQAPYPSSVLTIGNFDGVHLGHQALLAQLVARAKLQKIPSVVMIFEPHPVKVLYPDRHLNRIFPLEDQVQQFEKLGVGVLAVEPFSREFSQLPPERYLQDWILGPFSPETVVVGHDFSFGANRGGSIDFLKSQGAALGFRVEIVGPVKVGDIVVSSSRIREALLAGEVELAGRLLGRSFYLQGLVVKGAGRGRQLGLPTANLNLHGEVETSPALGVYAAWADVRGKKRMAAVNIGKNPTFNEVGHQPPTIEAHVLDFPMAAESADLYGENLRLDFVARLRSERKFPSKEALVEQIHKDIQECRLALGKSPG